MTLFDAPERTWTAEEVAALAPAPVPVEGARTRLRAALAEQRATVIVLDDDPTGTQSVHDVPVLTRWDRDDLRWAFQQGTEGFFILTNTRGLTEDAARARLTEVAAAIEDVAAELGTAYTVITRSDSTMRGHYPLETDVFEERAAAAGTPYDAVLLVPAYLAAGRITIDDVHYVEADGVYVPVGQTGYAQDPSFGFTSSDLKDYVAEKTAGRIAADAVSSLTLDDIRVGGAGRIAELILRAKRGAPIVVNAVEESDLDVVALGLLEAEKAGAKVLTRSGPSFVAARLGIEAGGSLSRGEIFRQGRRTGHGLIVVGSHVELTTRQLGRLELECPDVVRVELNVPRVLDPEQAQAEVERVRAELVEALADRDALLLTSRARVDGTSGASSLAIAQTVSAALVGVTAQVVRSAQVAWVLAKGGITSSDVATDGLGMRRAIVAGQLFPGIVSVWLDETDERTAGMPYVVFAGNVGDESTLAAAVRILRDADEPAP